MQNDPTNTQTDASAQPAGTTNLVTDPVVSAPTVPVEPARVDATDVVEPTVVPVEPTAAPVEPVVPVQTAPEVVSTPDVVPAVPTVPEVQAAPDAVVPPASTEATVIPAAQTPTDGTAQS